MTFNSSSPVKSPMNSRLKLPQTPVVSSLSWSCKWIDQIKMWKVQLNFHRRKVKPSLIVNHCCRRSQPLQRPKQSYCSSYSLQVVSVFCISLCFFNFNSENISSFKACHWQHIFCQSSSTDRSVLASHFKWSPKVPWRKHNIVPNCCSCFNYISKWPSMTLGKIVIGPSANTSHCSLWVSKVVDFSSA